MIISNSIKTAKVLLLAFILIIISSCISSADKKKTTPFKRHHLVEKLPIISTLNQAPITFILRGKLTPHRKIFMIKIANHVINDILYRYIDNKPKKNITIDTNHIIVSKKFTIDVCLFERTKEYNDFLFWIGLGAFKISTGMYSPKARVICANIGNSYGNLMHELAHPLITYDYPGVPVWLNEGIATLYGNSKSIKIKNRTKMRYLVNYRLSHLKEAYRKKILPTFKELLMARPFNFYSLKPREYYALSRYILFYLDRKNQLSPFYKEIKKAGGNRVKHLKILNRYIDYKTFISWVMKLR